MIFFSVVIIRVQLNLIKAELDIIDTRFVQSNCADKGGCEGVQLMLFSSIY